jgi:ligand-binding sensor domain-containing protein/signal transduction histidine kinase
VQSPWPRLLLTGLVSLFVSAGHLLAGEPEGPGQYVVDTIGTDVGLPQTNVTSVWQARDGYLWVGTEGGLGRFDGTRFTTFRHSNTPAFLSHSIRCVFEDRAGDLWFGTERGLVHYHDGRFEHVGLADTVVTALADDRAGRLWVGTNNQGLQVWHAGKFEPAAQDEGALGSSIHCLYVDHEDRVWVGFDHKAGLACGQDGHFRRFEDNRITGEFFSICEQPAGTLWLGGTRGLFRLRGRDVAHAYKNGGLVSSQVTDVRPAQDGGLWVVASVPHKVNDLDHFAFDPITRIPTENARTLCEDREGNLWVCAQADGLIRVRRTYYRLLSTDEGLPGNVVKAVTEDRDGNLWLAVQRHGVTRVAPDGTVTVYTMRDGFASDDPISILAARDGTVWASFNQALCSWRDGKCQRFPRYPAVRTMFQDRQGTLWFGSEGRLLKRPPGGEFAPVSAEGKPVTSVQAITEDAAGAIYIGTSSGCVIKLAGDTATIFDQNIGGPNGGLRALYVDHEQRIWVGLRGRGLGVLIDGRWHSSETLVEAVTDHVSAIMEDDHGQLWLGTPSGIMWAPKEVLLAAALGKAKETLRMRIAGLRDGARVIPASSSSQPAAWPARDGSFLFGTRRGLLAIDSHYAPPNAVAPPVHIERVRVDGRSQPTANQVTLPPDVRQLDLEYTAISFIQPSRVLFRYKLEGYDTAWIEAGTRRLATYPHLPSGKYVFRVSACNADGIWSEQPDQIEIVQAPYFYERGWFYALVAAAVVTLGLAWHRYSHRRLRRKLERLEQKQAMERERRRIAKNLHDDLGASLTEIGLYTEAARRKVSSPEAIEAMGVVSARVRGLADTLDAVVWTVNPANDSLNRLTTYVCDLFQDLFSVSTIRGRIDVAGEMPAIPLSPEERSNLFFTVKEALNNTLKHSDATEVWLRIKMEGDRFRLRLEDNGRGFDLSSPEHGKRNGLSNMRSRVAELGGALELQSLAGQGTVLSLSISFAGRMPARESEVTPASSSTSGSAPSL